MSKDKSITIKEVIIECEKVEFAATQRPRELWVVVQKQTGEMYSLIQNALSFEWKQGVSKLADVVFNVPYVISVEDLLKLGVNHTIIGNGQNLILHVGLSNSLDGIPNNLSGYDIMYFNRTYGQITAFSKGLLWIHPLNDVCVADSMQAYIPPGFPTRSGYHDYIRGVKITLIRGNTFEFKVYMRNTHSSSYTWTTKNMKIGTDIVKAEVKFMPADRSFMTVIQDRHGVVSYFTIPWERMWRTPIRRILRTSTKDFTLHSNYVKTSGVTTTRDANVLNAEKPEVFVLREGGDWVPSGNERFLL